MADPNVLPEWDQLSIETPELVALDMPVAGIGSRFVALLVDYLIWFVAVIGFIIVIALVDPSPTMASLWTTPFWLLSGKKDFLKMLPPAGVDAASIQAASRFGFALRDALLSNEERGNAPLLSGLKAADSDPHLLVSEKAATRSFYLWGKLLRAVGEPGQLRRYPFLVLYVIFLITLISTVVPLSLLIQSLLRPFMRRRFAALKQRFDLPSGSGTERMHLYEH